MKVKFYAVLLLCMAISTILPAQPKVGEQAPDININNAAGRSVSLSGLRGKIVLVDFWASWCGPCRKSNRELGPVYARYRDKGFEIFGVSLDKEEADWKKAVAADKIKWIQTNQQGGWDAPVALAWKIEQLPSSFLLDASGAIIAINPSAKQIEQHLKKQLR